MPYASVNSLQKCSLMINSQIPAAWVVAFLPHAYAASLSKFDNRSPRTYNKIVENDQTIDQAVRPSVPLLHEWQSTNALQTKDKIIRCEGAQSNGFENLAFFATAVVAGNLAGLPSETLNTLSFGYIASRVVYNFIYITNTTGAMASLRSVVFLTGIGQIFTLFIKSGNALRDRAANLI
jgi:uncharacterized MAPEG superfamily protein